MSYDFYVTAREIIPPMPDGRKWTGKVMFLREISTGMEINPASLFSDEWSFTKAEALEKIRRQVEAWISSKQ